MTPLLTQRHIDDINTAETTHGTAHAKRVLAHIIDELNCSTCTPDTCCPTHHIAA